MQHQPAVVDRGAAGVGVDAGERLRTRAGLRQRAVSSNDAGEREIGSVVDRQRRATRNVGRTTARSIGVEAADHLITYHIQDRAGME